VLTRRKDGHSLSRLGILRSVNEVGLLVSRMQWTGDDWLSLVQTRLIHSIMFVMAKDAELVVK
jgi:hypothetical protein